MKWMVLAFVVCAARLAYADPEVTLRVMPGAGSAAPTIEATIIGAPIAPVSKITIAPAGDPAHAIAATAVRDYAHGDEPVAIAFVVQGGEIWAGNDTYTAASDPACYHGALASLEAAIDHARLGAHAPKGSLGLIVNYSRHATVRLATTDLRKLTGRAFGKQKDFHNALGNDLVEGVTLAIGELDKATTPRKVLIIIGDGMDTDPDKARPALAELKKTAAKDAIDVEAIVYNPLATPDPDLPVHRLTPRVKVLEKANELTAALEAIVAAIGARYYVTFPGWDARRKTGLSWDGTAHDLVITIAGKALDPITLSLGPTWHAP